MKKRITQMVVRRDSHGIPELIFLVESKSGEQELWVKPFHASIRRLPLQIFHGSDVEESHQDFFEYLKKGE